MADLFYPETQPNRRATALGLEIMPATFGEGFGAAFEDTLTRNPTASLLRSAGRARYYGGTYVDEFGNEQDIPSVPSTILSPDEANERYGIKGRLKFDAATPEPVAEELRRLKVREIELQDIRRRADAGIGTALTAGLLGSLLDPLNIGMAFVPVVGPARYAALAARMGVPGARVATGAIEGAVGAALLEPAVLGVAMQEQADYSAVDSIANIVFGTAIGGGLHLGAGYIGDRMRASTDAPPLPRVIDSLPVQDQVALLRTAVAQAVEGRPVDVAPVMDAATGAQRDADFVSGLRREWAREVDNELARITGDRGAGLPANLDENSSLARLIDKVAEQTQRGLEGPLAERVKSLEPDLKAIFPQPEPKSAPPLTPAQRLKAAVEEMQADPGKLFEAAKTKPEIFKILAKASDEFDAMGASPDAEIRGADAGQAARPADEAVVREAVQKAHEPYVDPTDAQSAASATERVADVQGPPKALDEETRAVEEELVELETYLPEGTERSAEAKEAMKEASLYGKAWRAAAACRMRKS